MRAAELAASIISDAKQRAHEIEKDSMREIHAYEEETLSILGQKKKVALAAVQKHEHEERARKEAQAQRASALELLTARQEIIDDVFAEARDRLENLSGKQRKELLEHLWKRSKEQLTVGTVLVADPDVAFFRRKAKATTQEGIGGFVAVSKDGNVSVDMTFETLLASVRTRKLQEVAGVLFKE